MNKAELIEVVASRIDASKKESAEYVQAVVDAITEAVAKGQKVSISGFGVFEKAARPARTYRKPSTGEEIPKQATWVPRFRPGGDFKALVSGEKNFVSLARTTAGDLIAAAGSAVDSAVDQAKAAVGMKSAEAPASAQPKAPSAKAEPVAAAPAAEAAAPAADAPAKKAPAKRAPAKRAPAKRAPAKRAAAAAPQADSEPTEMAAEAPVKKAPAKRAPAKRTAKKAAAPAPETAPSEVTEPPASEGGTE